MRQWLEKQFRLSESHTNIKTELLAGITTFVTMAYVLATVPNMLESAGLDKHVMFTVLILLVILTTCAMALYTNRPFALAPGLGSVGIVTAMMANDGIAPSVTAGVIFWSGVLFIAISSPGLREAVIGFIILLILKSRKIQEDMILAIAATTIVGIPFGVTKMPESLLTMRQELKDRFANGMFVEIQEKMLRQEVLDYIIENRPYEHCSFVTDDTMADELMEYGQLNHVVQTAVSMGFPLEEAIYCVSYTPARRMNLRDRGAIAPGRKTDFQLLKAAECSRFEPERVFKDGREIYRKGAHKKQESTYAFPEAFYDSLHLPELTAHDLIPAEGIAGKEAEVRVIQVQDGCTQTKEIHRVMPVKDGRLQWEGSGCMLAAVFERHGINGNIGYGFVTGDCISRGAAATTYYHDHHNLLVIGSNVDDMLVAAKAIT